MENASKALIMAGGILIALMVIGALILMFNQISAYKSNNTSSQKDIQIATFNQDFLKYFDEKQLKGTDIISITNKVVDYNLKENVTNYVDLEKKITLNIDLSGFANNYGVGNVSKLFNRQTLIKVTNAENSLSKAIIRYSSLEKKYSLSTMGKLKSNYASISSGTKTIEQATGKAMPEVTIEDIAKYIEYTELKSAIFEPTEIGRAHV